MLTIDRKILDGRRSEFEQYATQLKKWSKIHNLTAFEADEDIYAELFLDSLATLPHIQRDNFVIDLGCGAGFPGLPLKIINDSICLCLVDKARKKINFCNLMILQLHLSNVKALAKNVDDIDHPSIMNKFDVVVSKATWQIKNYLPIAVRFMRAGGKIIAYKGDGGGDELTDATDIIKEFNLSYETFPYSIESGPTNRQLIIFKRK